MAKDFDKRGNQPLLNRVETAQESDASVPRRYLALNRIPSYDEFCILLFVLRHSWELVEADSKGMLFERHFLRFISGKLQIEVEQTVEIMLLLFEAGLFEPSELDVAKIRLVPWGERRYQQKLDAIYNDEYHHGGDLREVQKRTFHDRWYIVFRPYKYKPTLARRLVQVMAGIGLEYHPETKPGVAFLTGAITALEAERLRVQAIAAVVEAGIVPAAAGDRLKADA